MQTEFHFSGSITKGFGNGRKAEFIHTNFELGTIEPNLFGIRDLILPQKYSLSVTSFVQVADCPKLFAGSLTVDQKFKYNLKDRPVYFDLGTLLDRKCKTFIELKIEERIEHYIKEREKLKIDAARIINRFVYEHPKSVIKKNKVNAHIEEVLTAYDNFCETFKNTKNATNHPAYIPRRFSIGHISLGGRIDLFLMDKNQENFVLLDLKYRKFGPPIANVGLPEFLQVLLYAYDIRKNGIQIDYVGFYFLHENIILLQKYEALENQGINEFIEHLCDELAFTRTFKPRECRLCLICALKENCPIGKSIKKRDLQNPLQI